MSQFQHSQHPVLPRSSKKLRLDLPIPSFPDTNCGVVSIAGCETQHAKPRTRTFRQKKSAKLDFFINSGDVESPKWHPGMRTSLYMLRYSLCVGRSSSKGPPRETSPIRSLIPFPSLCFNSRFSLSASHHHPDPQGERGRDLRQTSAAQLLISPKPLLNRLLSLFVDIHTSAASTFTTLCLKVQCSLIDGDPDLSRTRPFYFDIAESASLVQRIFKKSAEVRALFFPAHGRQLVGIQFS